MIRILFLSSLFLVCFGEKAAAQIFDQYGHLHVCLLQGGGYVGSLQVDQLAEGDFSVSAVKHRPNYGITFFNEGLVHSACLFNELDPRVFKCTGHHYDGHDYIFSTTCGEFKTCLLSINDETTGTMRTESFTHCDGHL